MGSEPRCPLRPHSPSEPPSPHLQCARHAETPHTGPGGKGRAGRESARESSLYGHRVLGEWTCAVRLTQNTSLKLMSLVCFLFFLMQRQGNFTPGLWLRPGAVALGGGGAGRVSASAGRSAQAGAPACGDTARTQPAAHAGRSRQRGVTVRSRLLGPNTRCSGGRGSRAWTRHPVSPCQPPGPPAPRQGLWVLCPLGPPEPAPLGLSTLEEGGSPTPGCRPPQLLLQDQGAHPSDASLPHTARN